MLRIGCLLVLVVLTLPCASFAAQARPNVVFLLADDLGWRDTSTYGSTFYETPNVDRLAERGMRFSNAYSANPLCSPTRASILTGQYPGRLRFTLPAGHLKEVVLDPIVPDRGPPQSKWVTPQTRTRLPLEYYTLAEALADAGYATAHFGKWHLGWPPYQPVEKRVGCTPCKGVVGRHRPTDYAHVSFWACHPAAGGRRRISAPHACGA
jgi:arylsulfatase A-like enzyme